MKGSGVRIPASASLSDSRALPYLQATRRPPGCGHATLHDDLRAFNRSFGTRLEQEERAPLVVCRAGSYYPIWNTTCGRRPPASTNLPIASTFCRLMSASSDRPSTPGHRWAGAPTRKIARPPSRTAPRAWSRVWPPAPSKRRRRRREPQRAPAGPSRRRGSRTPRWRRALTGSRRCGGNAPMGPALAVDTRTRTAGPTARRRVLAPRVP
ncbi:MAG: hypothetical protein QOE87_461 [Gaiellales bacterium]|nr:hypothetical protein [Gaiellales bacterium]